MWVPKIDDGNCWAATPTPSHGSNSKKWANTRHLLKRVPDIARQPSSSIVPRRRLLRFITGGPTGLTDCGKIFLNGAALSVFGFGSGGGDWEKYQTTKDRRGRESERGTPTQAATSPKDCVTWKDWPGLPANLRGTLLWRNGRREWLSVCFYFRCYHSRESECLFWDRTVAHWSRIGKYGWTHKKKNGQRVNRDYAPQPGNSPNFIFKGLRLL